MLKPNPAGSSETKPKPPNVLLLNAGVCFGNEYVEDKDPAKLVETFGVNVFQLFWATQAFLPHMIAFPGGSDRVSASPEEEFQIITVASAAGLSGMVRGTDYSSSKHAAVGFMDSLTYELAARAAAGESTDHISATVICPFLIDTGMFDGATTNKLMLPMLDVEKVANDIVDRCGLSAAAHRRQRQVSGNGPKASSWFLRELPPGKRPDRVVLPPLLNTLPIFRLIPLQVRLPAYDFLGSTTMMDSYVGKRDSDSVGKEESEDDHMSDFSHDRFSTLLPLRKWRVRPLRAAVRLRRMSKRNDSGFQRLRSEVDSMLISGIISVHRWGGLRGSCGHAPSST